MWHFPFYSIINHVAFSFTEQKMKGSSHVFWRYQFSTSSFHIL